MADPVHAVVIEKQVDQLILMDTATAELFREYGFVEMMWGSASELVDVTDVDPQPQMGWSYNPDADPVWIKPVAEDTTPVEETPTSTEETSDEPSNK
jgi:hypothetical protein